MAKRYTQEWKDKISKSLKGRVVWNKGLKFPYKPNLKLKGRISPMKGRIGIYKRSEETKSKMKKAWNYDKHITPERNRKISQSRKGIKVKWSEDAKKHMSRFGNQNGNWIDGRSFEPYNPLFNKKIKLQIKQRDNNICRNGNNCKGVLTIHHINYDKSDCDENNLITLCARHNSLANSNRDYWRNFYEQLNNSSIRR